MFKNNTNQNIQNEKGNINEVFILRSIACLSIVLLHSIANIQNNFLEPRELNQETLTSFRVLLTFGTPAFVFISELLISYSYRDKVPQGFLLKRFNLIMIPFLFMAAFHGLFSDNIPEQILLNILGGYHGYFVLIIFQFYILHILFHKYLAKSNPSAVILISFIVNIVYLAVFNFVDAPSNNNFLEYFWERGYFILFFGWVSYFVLAYYCGIYYSKFIDLLKKYYKFIFLSFIITSIVAITVVYNGILIPSSKTVPMLLFTMSAIGTLYYIALNCSRVPKILEFVSKYSFSIYLLHIFVLNVVQKLFEAANINFGLLNIFIFFIGAVTGSIIIAYLLNRFRFGKYLVGRVGLSRNEIALKRRNSTVKKVDNAY